MKTTLFLLTTLFTFTLHAQANNDTQYKNDEGCLVTIENHNNGKILWIQKENSQSVVGFTHDLKNADFVYCSQEAIQINSYTGKYGSKILIGCSENQNDHATTRGRVDIEIMNGHLQSLSVDGQVKKLLYWKQDVQIKCDNLQPVVR